MLARRLAKALKTRLGKIELSKFPNDEIRVWVKEKKPGKRAVVVQSLSHRTDNHLMQFCLICDALKRLGVNKIIAVIPWMGYSKQDKVFRPGEPLSAAVVAKMLEVTPLTKIITYDLHKPEIARFFKTKIVNLSGRRVFREYFKNNLDKETVVVAPDEGARKSSKRFAYDLGAHVAYIKKKRDLNTGETKVLGVSRCLEGKKILIKDDMISTGGTLLGAIKFLKTQKVASILLAATHHLYLPGVQAKLDQSGMTSLVVTDTVEPKAKSKKLKVISVAEMIAKEIRA